MADVEARLAVIERNQNDLKDAVVGIQRNLESLVRLEERHAETREALGRVFTYTEKLEERIEDIEKVLPGLVEMRGWLVKADLCILGIVGLAVIGLVIIR